MCQVTLSCSISRGGNVSYAWYRGSDLIQTARNLSILEERIDPKDMHTYTCNVSNPVSWDSQTLRLTQGCLSAQQSKCSALGNDNGCRRCRTPWSGACARRTGRESPWLPPSALALPQGVLASGTCFLYSQASRSLGRVLSPSGISFWAMGVFPSLGKCVAVW